MAYLRASDPPWSVSVGERTDEPICTHAHKHIGKREWDREREREREREKGGQREREREREREIDVCMLCI